MQEKFLPMLILLGIAYAGISAWKNTKKLQKLNRELPDEGKLELEKNHPLLKLNGKAVVAISWLSALVGVALFLWVILKLVIAL
jgi:hypothetical protein